MKVKVFSHNDLDGVGCVIVANVAFYGSLTYNCCSYGSIDKKVKEFLLSPEVNETDLILITDISVSDPEVIELIEQKAKNKLMLLDHHATALHLNEYSWARVAVEEEYKGKTRKSSGTSLLYQFLLESGLVKEDSETRQFVEFVRDYDTWDWHNVSPRNYSANDLNTLFFQMGSGSFIRRFSKNRSLLLSQGERMLLDAEKTKIEKHIYRKRFELKKLTGVKLADKEYNIGYVFSDSYISELGNILAEENLDLDFIAIIAGGGNMSFRTIRTDIDLGAIASEFIDGERKGGGHKQAAGAPILSSLTEKFVHSIFNI